MVDRWDRRRFLLTSLVGVCAVPIIAEAQQVSSIAKVGVLTPFTTAAGAHAIEAFRKGMRELGHVEGKTFVIEGRSTEARSERLPDLARELVRLKVDVIVASNDLAVAAAKRATWTIPIVMTFSTDPVETGIVASLARPGGNVTGLTNAGPELGGKRLDLLMEVIPKVSRVAFIWNPDIRGALFDYKQTEVAARSLRLALLSVEVTRAEDLDRAFTVITEQRTQALIVQGPNPVLFSNPGQIVGFAQQNRLPSMYAAQEYVNSGGLMSYGASVPELYRRAATFVDKILKGAKPADLPVEQPTKFELVINLKTAKALGLTIPPSLLARADQIIE